MSIPNNYPKTQLLKGDSQEKIQFKNTDVLFRV